MARTKRVTTCRIKMKRAWGHRTLLAIEKGIIGILLLLCLTSMKTLLLLSFSALLLNCLTAYYPQPILDKYYEASDAYFTMEEEYHFGEAPPDPQYGTVPDKAVPVAFRKGEINFWGPSAERFYIAHLRCKCGGKLGYNRQGSCCSVPSKNAPIGDSVPLDIYRFRCYECGARRTILMNMYDSGKVYAPIGFVLKR